MSIIPTLRLWIGTFLRFSGISFFLREVVLRNRNTIIYYHCPSAMIFEKHLEYLIKRYNIISLDALVQAIVSQDWSNIPSKSMVITIDDGYKENFALLNVIKKYKIPVTIYLSSHVVNTKRRFWFEAGFPDNTVLMRFSNQQRLAFLAKEVGFHPTKAYEEPQALNDEQIMEMSPFVDFQSHGRYHFPLGTCSDEESNLEIRESRVFLGEKLKKEIEHFSYPNGSYGEREITYLKNEGYVSSVTVDVGWNTQKTSSFTLKRMPISDDAPINELVAQLFGIACYFHFLFSGSWGGKRPKDARVAG